MDRPSVEAEAGPSRQRRPTTPTRQTESGHVSAQRPASPETALAGREERERDRERARDRGREVQEESDGHGDRGSGPEGARKSGRPGSMDGQDTRMSPEPPSGASHRSAPPASPPAPRLDLAKFNTPALLRLLANLLQQIANANDQIRPELDEYEDEDGTAQSSSTRGDDERQGRSRSKDIQQAGSKSAASSRAVSRASSTSTSTNTGIKRTHPSPTSALFPNAPATPLRESAPAPAPAKAGSGDHLPGSLYAQPPDALFSASKTSLHHPAALLSFHARHVPSISIEAYLLRILKYCPTTNEVFLSLLVYFDRMSKLGTAQGLGGEAVDPTGNGNRAKRGFAIDSYNVHRLVIAGVTVASKFFSDVFYTNSRYAKVGGLPPSELNQLELQFLLLNDFRLAIPIEEMQRYGDRLLVYSENKEQINLGLAAEAQAGVAHPAAAPATAPIISERRSSAANGMVGQDASPSGAAAASDEQSSGSIPHRQVESGTAVVKGASEAMDVDDDAPPPPAASTSAPAPAPASGRSVAAPSAAAPAETPMIPTAPTTITSTAPVQSTTSISTSQAGPATSIVSRSVSFQRTERTSERERERERERDRERERGDVSIATGPGAGLRWGGAAEGLVSGAT